LNETGVVAALAAEARTLGVPIRRRAGLHILRDGTLVGVSGIGCAGAESTARALIDAGAGALLSFGMAGGLDPTLDAGAICVPSEVISFDGARFLTAQGWAKRVSASLTGSVAGGKLLTSAHAIGTIEDKARAYLETGAALVDMESLGVARIAAVHGVPFIAVRVIVDTAADALPAAVASATRDGRVRIGRLIRALARSPADLGAILRLARRYRAATRSLAAVARSGALAKGAPA
jgi:adenosylhomocysteine nucleosidase